MSHVDEGRLHAWLDRALPPQERAVVEAHLADCAECRARFESAQRYRARTELLLALAAPEAVEPPAFDAIRARAFEARRAAAPAPDRAEPAGEAVPVGGATPPAARRLPRALAWAAAIIVALGLAALARTLVLSPVAEKRIAAAADEGGPARAASTPARAAFAPEAAPVAPPAEPLRAAGARSPAPPGSAAGALTQARADTPRLALEEPVAAGAGPARALGGRDAGKSLNEAERTAAAAPAPPAPAPVPSADAAPPPPADAPSVLADRAAVRDTAGPTKVDSLAARADVAPRAQTLAKSRAAAARLSTRDEAAADRPDRRRAVAEVMLGTRIRLVPGLPLLDVLVVHDPSGRVAAAALQRLPSGDTIEILQRPESPAPAAAPPVSARGLDALPPARTGASALSVTRDGVSLTLRAAVPPDSLVTLLERIR